MFLVEGKSLADRRVETVVPRAGLIPQKRVQIVGGVPVVNPVKFLFFATWRTLARISFKLVIMFLGVLLRCVKLFTSFVPRER